jgi:DnaJ domain
MLKQSPYKILGVAKDATTEQIKRAYRRRSSETHPDRDGGDDRSMQEVNDAYALLSDAVRRRHYDESGYSGKEASLAELAQGLLATELAKLLDNGCDGDIALILRNVIDTIASDGKLAYGNHVQCLIYLQTLNAALNAKPGTQDFLRPVFTQRIEACEAAIVACERLCEAAKTARTLLETYRFEAAGGTRIAGSLKIG